MGGREFIMITDDERLMGYRISQDVRNGKCIMNTAPGMENLLESNPYCLTQREVEIYYFYEIEGIVENEMEFIQYVKTARTDANTFSFIDKYRCKPRVLKVQSADPQLGVLGTPVYICKTCEKNLSWEGQTCNCEGWISQAKGWHWRKKCND